ncbi:hypothetical protein EGK_00102, partial [Macaca mulatta]
TASAPHGAKPHGCHGGRSQPPTEAQVHGPGRRPFLGRVGLPACPIQVLGPRAARSSHRRVKAASSLQGPRPGAPRPMAHSCTRFVHCRGPPTRTQAGSKRGKRPKIQRRPRARVPADSDDTDATGPPAALLEGLLLGDGKPSPHSTRPGPFFYIGGNNGAAM